MSASFVFQGDTLTADDLTSLRRLAAQLRDLRRQIAREWSQRLIDLLPAYFASGDVSLDQLTAVNESFLSLVLEHIERDAVASLFETYYRLNRQLIDADLQRAPAMRISLGSLYTSARVSLQVIETHLREEDQQLLTAYTKLTAELMMIVGQAYSDAREEYLQRAFEQINVLSHELRAPLSHLFGYLDLLSSGGFGPVSAEQEDVLRQLIHETDDVLWLLTGTLDLSRLETGRVEVRIEEFPLDAVFVEVERSTPHANVPLSWWLPPQFPPLRTDRVKVKQILGNLVRNAVRYGGNRPVTLTAALRKPDTLEISVRDQGPGIPSDDLEVIFNFLERGHGAGLTRDGYGIGLHVVQRMVRLLGGTITVESKVGAGACFRFTLPLQPPQSVPATT